VTGGGPAPRRARGKRDISGPPTVIRKVPRRTMRIRGAGGGKSAGPVFSAIPFTDTDELIRARQRHHLRLGQRGMDSRTSAKAHRPWPKRIPPRGSVNG